METVRIGVNHACADAAARGLAADEQAIDTEHREMRNQRRAVKAAGAFFVNDEIAGLGLECLVNLKSTRIVFLRPAVGRMDTRGLCFMARFAGCINDR